MVPDRRSPGRRPPGAGRRHPRRRRTQRALRAAAAHHRRSDGLARRAPRCPPHRTRPPAGALVRCLDRADVRPAHPAPGRPAGPARPDPVLRRIPAGVPPAVAARAGTADGGPRPRLPGPRDGRHRHRPGMEAALRPGGRGVRGPAPGGGPPSGSLDAAGAVPVSKPCPTSPTSPCPRHFPPGRPAGSGASWPAPRRDQYESPSSGAGCACPGCGRRRGARTRVGGRSGSRISSCRGACSSARSPRTAR